MKNIGDERIVLAIDAASVSARASVSEDGNVKGLLYKNIIEDARQVLSSPKNFTNFVEDLYSEIIRYYFVVYACPLSSDAQSFPIALIPRISGNANKEIVAIFQQIVQRVNQKLNVIGTTFDGDSGWLFLAKQAANASKENIIKAIFGDIHLLSLENYMFYNDDDHPDFLIFEDPLHLLKCL